MESCCDANHIFSMDGGRLFARFPAFHSIDGNGNCC